MSLKGQALSQVKRKGLPTFQAEGASVRSNETAVEGGSSLSVAGSSTEVGSEKWAGKGADRMEGFKHHDRSQTISCQHWFLKQE